VVIRDSRWGTSGGGAGGGKLRRLKDLALDVSRVGRVYQSQGLAASGGGRPLPMLWRVVLASFILVEANPDQLMGLLLPSVRVFMLCPARCGSELTACNLRQAGYKHAWGALWPRDPEDDLEHTTVLQVIVGPCRIFGFELPTWIMTYHGDLPDDDCEREW
jgi:hypothetical protein